MKFPSLLLAGWLLASSAQALIPGKFTELNQYVVKAPNQGTQVTCLFMASTGAMEILLAKKMGLKKPKEFGVTDLSERYLITLRNQKPAAPGYWFEDAFLLFNNANEAILAKDMPFEAYDEFGTENDVWAYPENFESAPRIKLPKVETKFLFSEGDGQYSTNVLNESHVQTVKEALVKYRSPIITIGNDEDYWHVTVIVGYDDNEEGSCYELDSKVCRGKKGAFYVRDSFGHGLEKRSYEWFIRRQNSASVAKLADGIENSR